MLSSDTRFSEFVRLFNDEKFFEAHEVLETLWRQTKTADRDFYQGLIQIAAAFVHVQRKNPIGAQNLHGKASRLLSAHPQIHLGINTGQLLKDAEICLAGKAAFPKLLRELF